MAANTKVKVNRFGLVLVVVALVLATLGLWTHSRWFGAVALMWIIVGVIALIPLRERWTRADKADSPADQS